MRKYTESAVDVMRMQHHPWQNAQNVVEHDVVIELSEAAVDMAKSKNRCRVRNLVSTELRSRAGRATRAFVASTPVMTVALRELAR